MRDVLGTDRLLIESTLERGAQRRLAMCLQQPVQPIDFVNPSVRPPIRQLREIRERCRAEIDEMLALQVPAGAGPPEPRDPRVGVGGQHQATGPALFSPPGGPGWRRGPRLTVPR